MTDPIQAPRKRGRQRRPSTGLSFDPCWFDAPPERSSLYYPAFAPASRAVQAILRSELPQIYLADIERFRDTRMIYPLLVYAASRPFPGQPRTEFTYDILNRAIMKKFHFSVGVNLPVVLASVSERLRNAGMDDVARHYRPDNARVIMSTVERLKVCRRRLESLLVSETLMVNSLLLFAGSKSLPPSAQARIMEKCEKVWLSRLRRLFAKQDYTQLAPQLLAAATEAFKSYMSSSIEAA